MADRHPYADVDSVKDSLDLDPSTTAILVIDMQNEFLAEGAPRENSMGRTMVDDLSRFIDTCRDAGALIVFTQAVRRRSGHDMGIGDSIREHRGPEALFEGTENAEFYEPVVPKDDDVVVVKRRYSAFYGTDLDIVLRNSDIENVVITGVSNPGCPSSTAEAAMFRDYLTIFTLDLTASMALPDQGLGPKSAEEVHEVVCTAIGTVNGYLATGNDVLAAMGVE